MRTDSLAVLAALALATAGCAGRSGSSAADPGDPPDVPGEAPDTVGDAVADGSPADTQAPDARQPVPHRGRCMPNEAPFPVRPAVTDSPTLPPIRVLGRDIVDPDGKPVALRGVSFGSWLQMEAWIAGVGLVYEEELFERMPLKADEFGVRDLFDDAWAIIAAEWEQGLRSRGPLVDDVRAALYANLTEERESSADAFWAWFDSVPWTFDEQSLWEWVGRRDGWDKAMELREVFANTWITEQDVERVSAMGLNLVRVPVWYDALETDLSAGGNGFRGAGWRHLDDAARWARRHGVYLMIDLHGAPGGQGTSSHQGLRDGGHLWTEPACRAKAARLWKALSSYFDGDPHVAILDLLNEPVAARSAKEYREVHDALYKAVREADTDASFIVMAEDGYKAGMFLASPKEMGWTNAMFGIHLYPSGPGTAAEFVAQMEEELHLAVTRLGGESVGYMARFDCPLFLAGFGPRTGNGSWAAEAMDKTIAMLNQRGVHWAPWTWKYRAKDDIRGVLHPPVQTEQRLDISQPFEAVRMEFGSRLGTAGWVEFKACADSLRARSREPVVPLDLAGPLVGR